VYVCMYVCMYVRMYKFIFTFINALLRTRVTLTMIMTVTETQNVKILYDVNMQTDHEVEHWRPDIEEEQENIDKCQDLAMELFLYFIVAMF